MRVQAIKNTTATSPDGRRIQSILSHDGIHYRTSGLHPSPRQANEGVVQHFIWIGAISAAVSVAAGAFGAHGLKSKITPEMLSIFETGARYQMVHAIGLILIGLFGFQKQSISLSYSGWLMFAGTILFSGSLYGLALGAPRFLGPITPLGGLLFMIAWSVFAFSALRN